MLIKCPLCHTTYQLEGSVPTGRRLRCGKCGHLWSVQNSPAPSFAPTPKNLLSVAAAARLIEPAKKNQPAEKKPVSVCRPAVFPTTKPVVARVTKNKKNLLPLPATRYFLCATAAALVTGGVWLLREPIAQTMRQGAEIYRQFDAAFQPLSPLPEISSLAWNYDNDSPLPIIRLQGKITNPSAELLSIPTLKIRLLGSRGSLRKENTLLPARGVLTPYSSVNFEIDIDAPTETVKQVYAYFAE